MNQELKVSGPVEGLRYKCTWLSKSQFAFTAQRTIFLGENLTRLQSAFKNSIYLTFLSYLH